MVGIHYMAVRVRILQEANDPSNSGYNVIADVQTQRNLKKPFLGT